MANVCFAGDIVSEMIYYTVAVWIMYGLFVATACCYLRRATIVTMRLWRDLRPSDGGSEELISRGEVWRD